MAYMIKSLKTYVEAGLDLEALSFATYEDTETKMHHYWSRCFKGRGNLSHIGPKQTLTFSQALTLEENDHLCRYCKAAIKVNNAMTLSDFQFGVRTMGPLYEEMVNTDVAEQSRELVEDWVRRLRRFRSEGDAYPGLYSALTAKVEQVKRERLTYLQSAEGKTKSVRKAAESLCSSMAFYRVDSADLSRSESLRKLKEEAERRHEEAIESYVNLNTWVIFEGLLPDRISEGALDFFETWALTKKPLEKSTDVGLKLLVACPYTVFRSLGWNWLNAGVQRGRIVVEGEPSLETLETLNVILKDQQKVLSFEEAYQTAENV